MKIVSVATVKGGVGKTVVSAHLAAGLARLGCRTLLMDLDPQAHATTLMGVSVDPQRPCVGDTLLRDAQVSIEDVIVPEVRPKLSVAPASFQMTHHERQLYAWALRLKSVLRSLEPIQNTTDVVVMDCPPYVGGFMEAALHASDLTIAPIPAMAGSLRGLNELHNTWHEMQDGRDGKLACVINLWDTRTRITNARLMYDLENHDTAVLNTKIPRAEIINQAALGQKLVYDKAPSHPIADVFDAFAYEVWDYAAFGLQKEPSQEEAADLEEWTALEQAISLGNFDENLPTVYA